MVRRIGLVIVLVIGIILIAVLVNGCEASARKSALEDYNNSVASLNARSVSTGNNFFSALSGGTSDPTALSASLAQSVQSASTELSDAKGLSTPDEVKSAQQYFVSALQMRKDGMNNIAGQIGPALQSATSQNAVDTIAAEMARFYASDVLYKDYSVPQIVGALRAAGITVGGLGGQQLNSDQFLPSIQWLDPQHVATALHVTLPAAPGQSTGPIAPGLHGHALNSVSVGGSMLQTGSANSIPASPAPTFTLDFANTGQNIETNVKCKVTVSGSSDSGETTVPQTNPGQSYSCQVTLSAAPPTGPRNITAEIVPVPGEKNIANNFLTFPVTFQ